MLFKMPYLNAIINESLRMFPPAWISDRVSKAPDHVDGLDIPKDTMVISLIYHAHYRKEDWNDAHLFKPERFIENKKLNSFFPFGAGPRMCIGNNFAMLEMQIFLVQFFKQFNVRITEETDPTIQALITLKPKNGIKLHLS